MELTREEKNALMGVNAYLATWDDAHSQQFVDAGRSLADSIRHKLPGVEDVVIARVMMALASHWSGLGQGGLADPATVNTLCNSLMFAARDLTAASL